ncbi:hypothetical protein [Shewanella sp. 10N.286.54.B9]|uniref:hypothetical protein n=1 Tax=Shewanella sp. 10N.286.54.B9 TaxID=3229719 RepID=UPI003553F362
MEVRQILVLIFSVILLFSIEVEANSVTLNANERCGQNYCIVSVAHLMTNADKYEKRKVALVGIVDVSNPQSVMVYLDEGSFKHKIYENAVAVSAPLIATMSKEMKGLIQGNYVYIHGKYYSNIGSDKGFINGTIDKVESITLYGEN